jgi:hypothetical protein
VEQIFFRDRRSGVATPLKNGDGMRNFKACEV